MFVVKEEFLFAGDGLAVFCRGVEGPLLDGGDDGLVDAVAQAAGDLDVGDLAGGVDDYVEDDVAVGAVGERGEVGLRRGKKETVAMLTLPSPSASAPAAESGLGGGGGGWCWARLGWV